ncbi:MAG TPA: tetratricopeptide repeat protein [Thermomicrobiaceae bacterium]|nr:tetratricopeptide repeat protein [Thermomicrobiaceae bacterium]
MFDQVGRWLRRRQGIERNPVYRLASDVWEGRIPPERAYLAVESHALLNRLADGDLWDLDREAARIAVDDPERGLVLARLAILAARYKGFDRVLVDCNLRASEVLAEMGNAREQELHLREALHAAERIANVPGQRRALARLARLAFDRGETERARELLGRQLEAGREDVDTLEDVETALLLGDLARNDGDFPAAREFYHRAAKSARRVGHFAGVVDGLLRQVAILRDQGDEEAAALLLQQAQDAAERTIDTRLQVEIAVQAAALLLQHRQPQQARAQLVTALARAREMNDLVMESRCLQGLARIEQQAGHLAEAADHFRDLADLEQNLGNRSAAVRAMLDAAEQMIGLRDADGARAALESILPITESLEEPALRQRVLGLLGLAYGALDRRSEAVDCLMGALQDARKAGDRPAEGRWLLGVGEVLLQFGEVSDAVAAGRRALDVARETGNSRLEAQALALVGSISLARGLHREAEESLQRALGIARQHDDAAEQLHYLRLLAELGYQTRQPNVAVKYLRQALDVATFYGDAEMRSRFHGQLARLYQAGNHLADAEEHYHSAATAAEEAQTPVLLARALRGLATVQDLRGEAEAAMESYRKAIEATDEFRDARSAAILHYNLAALLYDREVDDEARRHLNRATELAMQAGDYTTADAARELMKDLAPPSGPTGTRPEDLLLGEVAINQEPGRFRDLRE